MKNSNIKEIFDIVNKKADAAKDEVIAADMNKVTYKSRSNLSNGNPSRKSK